MRPESKINLECIDRMTIADIKEYCKTQNVPLTAVLCTPHFDEKKKRITKGEAICHSGWKDKNRFESGKVKITPRSDQPATIWMMSLKKSQMYVIDIDVTTDSAKDILIPQVYNNLFNASEYVIETGSKGLHFYFKLPEISEKITNQINIDCKQWFIQGKEGSVDIIVDSIITEGSSYTYNDSVYKYRNIKEDTTITDVAENETVWDLVREFLLPNKVSEPGKSTGTITIPEIADHLNNIPNEIRNWDEWYKMAQTLFNTYQHDVREVFFKWSEKSQFHNDKEARKLWTGLRTRSDNQRTIGSILYLSRRANEDGYKKIRAKYNPLSYEALKQLLEEDHFFVQEPKPLYVRCNDTLIYYNPSQFKELLLNWTYTEDDKKISFYHTWSKDPTKRTYKQIGFYPNCEYPKNHYNSFVPCNASKLPEEKKDIEPILKHISIMANHDEKVSCFMIQFMAQIVQQPHVLPGIAILLYGQEGSGKDILISWFGKKILGNHQYSAIGDIGDVLRKNFNSFIENKFLLHSDEVNRQSMDKKTMENLKRMITGTDIRIERKGFDAIDVPSYTRFWMTTNNADALKTSMTDRRLTIVMSSNEMCKDINYFKELSEYLNRPEVIRAFYDYLMTIDISNFNHANRPETDMYAQAKRQSMDSFLVWITNEDFEEERLKTLEWLERYNQWADKNKMHHYNPTSFGLVINKYLDKGGITKLHPKNISHLILDRPKILEWMGADGLLEQ